MVGLACIVTWSDAVLRAEETRTAIATGSGRGVLLKSDSTVWTWGRTRMANSEMGHGMTLPNPRQSADFRRLCWFSVKWRTSRLLKKSRKPYSRR
jgi:hypothetical protein